MNSNRFLTLVFLFFLTYSLIISTACVSVEFGKMEAHSADGIMYQKPSPPFEKISAKNVDVAWKNSTTGSILSLVSECSEQNDPPLKSLKDDVVRNLSDREITQENKISFQNREAIRCSAKGHVDGVLSHLELLVFKKNGCSYIITLVSLPAFLTQDRPKFDEFLEGFHVP